MESVSPIMPKVPFSGEPPPTLADLVLRPMGEAVNKLPDSLQIFICTKIFAFVGNDYCGE